MTVARREISRVSSEPRCRQCQKASLTAQQGRVSLPEPKLRSWFGTTSRISGLTDFRHTLILPGSLIQKDELLQVTHTLVLDPIPICPRWHRAEEAAAHGLNLGALELLCAADDVSGATVACADVVHCHTSHRDAVYVRSGKGARGEK